MATLIVITDDTNTSITELDFGSVTGSSSAKIIRVWNNKDGLAGINDAVGVQLVLYHPSTLKDTIVAKNDCVVARCTYSAKQGGSYVENFKAFPISSTDYDEIASGRFNEYEIKIDMTSLSDAQKSEIEDKNILVGLIVKFSEKVPS